jgi:hypothetical protein
MAFTLTEKEARRLGLLPTDEQPKPARPARKHRATWSRGNIEDWEGPNGWRVGIARMPREDVMVDVVVAWREGKVGVSEVAEWETFKCWSVERIEAKLRELEKQQG